MDPRQGIPVIIDTDPGVDDIIAILLALASPELQILAFIISFGNTDIDSSYLNVFKAYQAISRHLERFPEDAYRFPNFTPARRPILVKGSAMPLEGELHSAQYFHGRDGLGGIDQRHPDLSVNLEQVRQEHSHLELLDRPGVDVALDLIRTHPPRSITYIALGPLTNLALMVRQDPECVRQRIGRVVCMGGALDVPGNTGPVSEFNFFADPYAVKELLLRPSPQEGLPLSRFFLLPLDITTPHELPFPIYQKAVDPTFHSTKVPSDPTDKPPLTHFTSSFLEKTREIMLQFGKDAMELHDIAAVWCAICNPPEPSHIESDNEECNLATGWSARKRIFEVERTGEVTRGMLVVDRRDDVSAYSPGANRAEVQKFLDTLHVDDDMWESAALPARVEIEASPSPPKQGNQGIWCVTRTPGPEMILQILLKRIWGVEAT